MKADRISLPEDTDEIRKLKTAIEQKNDFMIWLIEDSGELDHTNQDELWVRFEKWMDENE